MPCIVSAYASRSRLVVGQVKAAEKSNEITAIPELLETLCLKGAIVTIDAAGPWPTRHVARISPRTALSWRRVGQAVQHSSSQQSAVS